MVASAAVCGVLLVAVVIMLSGGAYADPDLLQDICVADLTSGNFFLFSSIKLFLSCIFVLQL